MWCELFVGAGTACKDYYTHQYVCCVWNVDVLWKIQGPYFSDCWHYCYRVPCDQYVLMSLWNISTYLLYECQRKTVSLIFSNLLLQSCSTSCPVQGPENGRKELLFSVHCLLSIVFIVNTYRRRQEYPRSVSNHLCQLS